MDDTKNFTESVERESIEQDEVPRERRQGSVATGLGTVAKFMLQSCHALNELPSERRSLSHCASCNDLYLSMSHNYEEHGTIKSKSTKMTSLSVWNESSQRSVSFGDNIGEMCSKLNYTANRRNRMRKDSAAAIALNRSRKSFLQSSCTDEDKELLLNSDVVVVYDERTSL